MHMVAAALAVDQSSFAEDLQVLGHGRFRDAQFLGKRPDAMLALQKMPEDLEPRGIAEYFYQTAKFHRLTHGECN